jgi:hypothetical protein
MNRDTREVRENGMDIRPLPPAGQSESGPGQPGWAGLSLVRIILDLRFLILDSLLIDDLRFGDLRSDPNQDQNQVDRLSRQA